MSAEQNKNLARRLIDEMANKGDLTIADEILSPDCVDRNPPAFLAEHKGIDSIKELAKLFRTAFPDEQYSIETIIAEGNMVAFQWRGTATHTGAFQGISPTNKKVSMQGATFVRIAQGKIVEIQVYSDALGLIQQLRSNS
jgi:steroid delta-isomerase-like uncharacterized protein